ncbi:unnamed protein product, partial [Cyprideis torosa]
MGQERESKRESEQLRKLFVGGLDFRTTDDTLKEYFAKYGEISDVVVMKDPKTRRSRGFGFVTFTESYMVDDVMAARPHRIDSREIEPKRAVPRDSKPESGVTSKRLFVVGIKDDMSEDQVKDYFSQFGRVTTVDFVKERGSDRRRGFGFVEFDDYDPVDKIIL